MIALLWLACTGASKPVALPPASTELEAQTFPVAITIDDLPYMTGQGGAPLEADAGAQRAASEAILDALGERPAAVFVNCGNFPQSWALVDLWRDAGHAIGNHTANHANAAHGELDEWLAGVRACDALWEADELDAVRWFRFPYLWRGETAERRDAVLSGLAEASYVPVPVTVDSHDWLFELAVRERPDLADEIHHLYVDNVIDATREARQISRDKLGREVAQILLLHVNDVTASHLSEVLAALEREGARFVSLDEAMSDPLYAAPDAWAGRGSRWWLARTAPTERPDGSPWYTSREATLRDVIAVLQDR